MTAVRREPKFGPGRADRERRLDRITTLPANGRHPMPPGCGAGRHLELAPGEAAR